MNDILEGIITGGLAVLVFVVVFELILLKLLKKQQHEAASGNVFAYDSSYKVIAIGIMLFNLVALYCMFVVLRDEFQGVIGAVTQYSFFLLSLSYTYHLIRDAYTTKVELNADGITKVGVFKTQRQEWSDIRSVSYNQSSRSIVLTSNNGDKMKLSLYLTGAVAIIKSLEQNVNKGAISGSMESLSEFTD